MKCSECNEELVFATLDEEDYGPNKGQWWHQGEDPKRDPEDPSKYHWPQPTEES